MSEQNDCEKCGTELEECDECGLISCSCCGEWGDCDNCGTHACCIKYHRDDDDDIVCEDCL